MVNPVPKPTAVETRAAKAALRQAQEAVKQARLALDKAQYAANMAVGRVSDLEYREKLAHYPNEVIAALVAPVRTETQWRLLQRRHLARRGSWPVKMYLTSAGEQMVRILNEVTGGS